MTLQYHFNMIKYIYFISIWYVCFLKTFTGFCIPTRFVQFAHRRHYYVSVCLNVRQIMFSINVPHKGMRLHTTVFYTDHLNIIGIHVYNAKINIIRQAATYNSTQLTPYTYFSRYRVYILFESYDIQNI